MDYKKKYLKYKKKYLNIKQKGGNKCDNDEKLKKYIRENIETFNNRKKMMPRLDLAEREELKMEEENQVDNIKNSSEICNIITENNECFKDRILGKGAYKTVYESPDIDGKTYAISIIEGNDKTIKGLKNEISIQRKLEGPNIFDFSKCDNESNENHSYYKIEDNLGTELYKFPWYNAPTKSLYKEFPDEYYINLKKIFKNDICGKINYIHTGKNDGEEKVWWSDLDNNLWGPYVHSDLKPENIIFDNTKENEKFILIDYGFARRVEEFRFGDQVGSPLYIDPSIVIHQYEWKMGTHSDIWSLGVIILELFCSINNPISERNNVKKLYLEGYKYSSGTEEISEDWVNRIFIDEKYNDSKTFLNNNKTLRDLVCNMLRRNIFKRYNITQVMDHDFWKEESIKKN